MATAASTVGGELIKEGLKTSLKPATEQFDANFLRGYKAKQHENALRDALAKTETAFRSAPGISAAQAAAILTRVAKLATDKKLQSQTLALLLTFDDPSPSRLSDDLIKAFGLNDAERPALAAFLYEFR